jgi:hypothetical protein
MLSNYSLEDIAGLKTWCIKFSYSFGYHLESSKLPEECEHEAESTAYAVCRDFGVLF